MASRVLHRHTLTALSSAGLGGLFALSLTQDMLAQGGMAVVAITALAAVLVGVPLSMASQRVAPDPDSPGGAVLNGLTEVWTAVAAGAAAGPVVSTLGPLGLILAGLAWVILGFGQGVRRIGAAVLTGVALLGLVGLGALSASEGPAWSLLQVTWLPWAPWVSVGLLGGLLVSGVGLAIGPDAPGESAGARPRGRMALAGLGVLAASVGALRVAAPFERGTLEAGFDPLWMAVSVVLMAAAVVGLGVGRGRRSGAGLIGLLATVGFAGPAAEALPLWWLGLLPLGIAASLVLRAVLARQATTLDRLTLVVGAVVASAIPFLGSPELPGPLAAGLLGLAPVAVVWAAGTRALLVRRTA